LYYSAGAYFMPKGGYPVERDVDLSAFKAEIEFLNEKVYPLIEQFTSVDKERHRLVSKLVVMVINDYYIQFGSLTRTERSEFLKQIEGVSPSTDSDSQIDDTHQ
jgi:hypothetical protein